MEIKKIVFGEKVPDKDDPNYKEKHEKTVEAGKSFAKTMRLDKAAAKVQGFATAHPKTFLSIIFGFVLLSVGLNLYRMSQAVTYKKQPSSAVERQEKALHLNRHHTQKKQPGRIQERYNPQISEEYGHFEKD